MSKSPIFYTLTDEAPALATYSFLPMVKAFLSTADVEIETKDISLANRILGVFSDYLLKDQKVEDTLATLGKLVLEKDANIIKLPNISASVPQLKEAIVELQNHGFPLPDYPSEPNTEEEKAVRILYDKIKGSAVNPVLREGNSDRRAPKAVKNFAKIHPHSMGEWSADSKTHVSSMQNGDFYGSEQSICSRKATAVDIVFIDHSGREEVLKTGVALEKDEIADSAVLSMAELKSFYKKEIQNAKDQDVLLSLHLKATMMKVSDPILFGACVETYFEEVYTRWKEVFEEYGVDSRNGLQNLYNALKNMPKETASKVLKDIENTYGKQPRISMVNSDSGITNLHVPSDVIIDASMPAMIRNGGKLWNYKGDQEDTKALIPDRSYAGVYGATIDFCKTHGAFDPTTMGSVSNVGLMAKKAEEYGSHDKTFQMKRKGKVVVRDTDGTVYMEHSVDLGDLFRMCLVKNAPVEDWIQLAIRRSQQSGDPVVFWLDAERSHDRMLRNKVQAYLETIDCSNAEYHILDTVAATEYTLDRVRKGLDTISATGNVLRDYLTDLFPILELGTSAKMLSIVPLMNGGGLFETGAGGSAPKHVEQFVEKNYLRWDSLGEFLALAVSLEHYAEVHGNAKAKVMGEALDEATERLLTENKCPTRTLGGIDNRGSHFYIALYWAEALSNQHKDLELKSIFSSISKSLYSKEQVIVDELIAVQGNSVEIKGYYFPDRKAVEEAMRPSSTLNQILGQLS